MKRLCAVVVILCVICLSGYVSASETNYVFEEKQRVAIPLSYSVKKVIKNRNENINNMSQPEDLFIDMWDNVYVADTGNNRILKFSKDGEVLGVYGDNIEKPLNTPMGVFVDNDGDMYVADTGNNRIVHLSSSGKFIEEFRKPESQLLGEEFIFDPLKIYVNKTGYIYVIKSHSFLTMDANSNFRGYVGQTLVGYDFKQALIKIFASKEQKERLAKKLPDSYTNFLIDKDGMIYAVCISRNTNQIVKLNSVGKNIFQDMAFGETTISESNSLLDPYFVDITVDDKGIISVLDQKTGKIYQYDQEGNLLTVFAGIGNWKGVFQMPTSIDTDKAGNIYALDRNLNNIQVYEPTKFIKLVHEAVNLYSNGEYQKAMELWEQVLEIDRNYQLAHKGIAKVLMKEEKWKDAMNEYIMADDKVGYTQAFNEYRHMILQKYFGWVVLSITLIITFAVLLLKKIKEIVNSTIEQIPF